jgi:predicted heme/steroid binding protein
MKTVDVPFRLASFIRMVIRYSISEDRFTHPLSIPIPSHEGGIHDMKKRLLWIPLVLVAILLAVQGCSTGSNVTSTSPAATATAESTATASPAVTAEPTAAPTATAAASTELVLTLDELAQYDGKNGNPAYIAVDGVIYDVTDVPQWKNGDHNGFTAGNDLTVQIKTISPHGVSKLKGLTVVGKLAE